MWSPRQPQQASTSGESKLDSLTVCNSSECLLCRNCPKSVEMSIVYRGLGLKSLMPTLPSSVSGAAEGSPRKNRMWMLQHYRIYTCNLSCSIINYKSNSVGVHRKLLSCKSGWREHKNDKACQTTKNNYPAVVPQRLQTFPFGPKWPFKRTIKRKEPKLEAARVFYFCQDLLAHHAKPKA